MVEIISKRDGPRVGADCVTDACYGFRLSRPLISSKNAAMLITKLPECTRASGGPA